MAPPGWKESGIAMFQPWAKGFQPWAKALCALLLGAASLSAQPAAPQPPLIRSTVTLVHVIATVKNQSGALIGSLGKDDFEIYDNGVKQEIAFLTHTTELPLSIALLLDTSGSTSKDLKYELDCASRFLRALLAEGNLEDSVGFYEFSYDVNAFPYTHSFARLDKYLKDLDRLTRGPHPELGTSLWDAMFYASRDLETRGGRKVIIVVTDGGDTTSHYSVHEALKAAQLADAGVYPVVVMPITSDAGRNTGGEHALTFMAQGTGGRNFLPAGGPELDKAFNEIVTELRTQYVLDFYPRGVPLPKDPFHKLEVRLKRPELRVSARNGYYGDAEATSSDPRVNVTPDRPAPPVVRKKNP
jgi:Ca-activated chloride channel homolog